MFASVVVSNCNVSKPCEVILAECLQHLTLYVVMSHRVKKDAKTKVLAGSICPPLFPFLEKKISGKLKSKDLPPASQFSVSEIHRERIP